LHSNGYDYRRRRAKWRCAKRCQHDPKRPVPKCAYLKAKYKHGYTVTIGRTHADGSVRLAREVPYGSPAWKQRYNRRNSAESPCPVRPRTGPQQRPATARAHTDACARVSLQPRDCPAR
jgi:hypothetical protein